jgi:hypothetical protein
MKMSRRRWFAGMVACAVAAALPMACGSPAPVGGPGGGGAGAGVVGSGTGGAAGFSASGLLFAEGGRGAGGVPLDGALALDGGPPAVSCGNTTITPARETVDIFIVLDRSASMYYSIAEDCYCAASIGGGTTNPLCAAAASCTNRWDAVSSALRTTMSTITTIDWGLEMFSTPGAGSCAVSTLPQVTLGTDNSTAAVQSAIAKGAPTGNTPTAAAIATASAYLPTVVDGRKRAILLATDGAPNCYGGQVNNTDDLAATLQAIAGAFALGIPVYVVGIGPSVGNLDSMAQAGGTGAYYPATSPAQLANALGAISQIVATTCRFETPVPPPDDSKVWVYVDKQLVAESAAEGWSFGGSSSTIVLTGSYCDNFLTGASSKVEVIFGCKDEPPPPIIP